MLESGVSLRLLVDRMRPLAEIMPSLLERLPLEPVIVLRGLWKILVGKPLAERTEPVAFEDGVLHVAVPDRRWRSELRALETELIGKINEMAGRALVRELRFVVREGKPAGEADREA